MNHDAAGRPFEVKRARLDPKVIEAWKAICARDAVLRRRLRLAVGTGLLAAFAIGLAAPAVHAFVPGAVLFALMVAGALTSAVAMIWNNVLVGTPACPSCGEPIELRSASGKTGRGHRRGALAHPEAQEWCPHCHAWLRHPSDPDRPLV